MRGAALFFAVVGATASAQTILPLQLGAEILGRSGLGVLKCQVQQLRPVLDFSFRFHAGYTARVPLSQYRGPGHKWTVVVRIEPELGGQTVYFTDRLNLPNIPDTKIDGEAGGGYLLGEGYYRASFLLLDDLGRGCRAEWNIEAQIGRSDRDVKMAIAPGTIQEVSLRGARSVSARGETPFGRLTVLLHAAPVSPRMSKVQARDAVTLLGSLSSLLDLAPAESVRLVVFNLDQHREIYREERFTLERLEAVRQAIFDLQLGVVDYQTLQNRAGHLDLLANLVTGELLAEKRSEAVVFLGPHSRLTDKRAFRVPSWGTGMPKFFYVEYQRPPMMAPLMGPPSAEIRPAGHAGSAADGPAWGSRDNAVRVGPPTVWEAYSPMPIMMPRDSIDYLVAMLKGKTLVVRTPGDFANAMKQIARQEGGK